MKSFLRITYCLLATTLSINSASSQDCDSHVRIVTQQGNRMYSTFNHLFNDRYGNAFTLTALTADSAVAIIFDFSDNKICVEDSAPLKINFTDGSEFEAKNQAGNNCNGRLAVYFTPSLNNMDQLQMFSTKTIASAKVWTQGNSFQHVRLQNPDLATRIKSSIGCLMAVVGKPVPPPAPQPIVEGDSNRVWVVVETQPEFEGGLEAMAKYIHKSLNKKKIKTPGTVFATFVVEKDGSIGDISMLRGIGKEADQEVTRVISQMPKWKPGKQNGKPVRVRYNLPLRL